MGCSFPGDWFKAIVGLKKLKDDRSKQEKVHSTTSQESNGSKSRHLYVKEPAGNLNDGASSKKAGDPRIPIEHIAAMRIQAGFRAFMARKVVHFTKGIVKFPTPIEADSAKKQALVTLSYIHSWSRIQAQIRARRLDMVTEGQSRQKKQENQLKLEAKLRQIEEEWCGGPETMDEIISRMYQREEAAVKRERAMAYAFSHQWRPNSCQYLGQAYYHELGKENWGWSWKERWIAVCPWETRVHNKRIIIPNRAQTKQGTNSKGAKTTYQPPMKFSVSVEPNLSNGKATTQPIKLYHPSAQAQSSQEANCKTDEVRASNSKA